MVVRVFRQHCINGPFLLKFYFLDLITADRQKFRSLEVLDSSLLEGYNAQIKRVYRQTSKSLSTNMIKTVKVMNAVLDYGLTHDAL